MFEVEKSSKIIDWRGRIQVNFWKYFRIIVKVFVNSKWFPVTTSEWGEKNLWTRKIALEKPMDYCHEASERISRDSAGKHSTLSLSESVCFFRLERYNAQ